jgi:hypothetical protein
LLADPCVAEMSRSPRDTAPARLLPGSGGTPARLVCAALVLALIVLAFRIATIW